MSDSWRGAFDPRAMFDVLASSEGRDEMSFEVVRDLPARVVGVESAEGISFSEDAMKDVFVALETFIGARIYARMRDGQGPSHMKVDVSLTFDQPVRTRPWTDDPDER